MPPNTTYSGWGGQLHSPVKKYFKYCVDGKDINRVSDFFDKNVVIYLPDCSGPIYGIDLFKKELKECVTDRYEKIKTTML